MRMFVAGVVLVAKSSVGVGIQYRYDSVRIISKHLQNDLIFAQEICLRWIGVIRAVAELISTEQLLMP